MKSRRWYCKEEDKHTLISWISCRIKEGVNLCDEMRASVCWHFPSIEEQVGHLQGLRNTDTWSWVDELKYDTDNERTRAHWWSDVWTIMQHTCTQSQPPNFRARSSSQILSHMCSDFFWLKNVATEYQCFLFLPIFKSLAYLITDKLSEVRYLPIPTCGVRFVGIYVIDRKRTWYSLITHRQKIEVEYYWIPQFQCEGSDSEIASA